MNRYYEALDYVRNEIEASCWEGNEIYKRLDTLQELINNYTEYTLVYNNIKVEEFTNYYSAAAYAYEQNQKGKFTRISNKLKCDINDGGCYDIWYVEIISGNGIK